MQQQGASNALMSQYNLPFDPNDPNSMAAWQFNESEKAKALREQDLNKALGGYQPLYENALQESINGGIDEETLNRILGRIKERTGARYQGLAREGAENLAARGMAGTGQIQSNNQVMGIRRSQDMANQEREAMIQAALSNIQTRQSARSQAGQFAGGMANLYADINRSPADISAFLAQPGASSAGWGGGGGGGGITSGGQSGFLSDFMTNKVQTQKGAAGIGGVGSGGQGINNRAFADINFGPNGPTAVGQNQYADGGANQDFDFLNWLQGSAAGQISERLGGGSTLSF
ncbi:MAG: hypothetical protein WC505_07255 [Patescibacteria group bacterium]